MTEEQTGDQSELKFNVWDILHILKKRWLVILAVFICISLLGIYKTYKKTYRYMATAKLAFNLTPDIQPLRNVNRSYWSRYQTRSPSYFQTQMEIMKSEPVARRVAQALGLIKDPKNWYLTLGDEDGMHVLESIPLTFDFFRRYLFTRLRGRIKRFFS